MPTRNLKPKVADVAKTPEKQIAKIPPEVYFGAAAGVMTLSLGLLFTKNKNAGIFFGQLAPSLLVIGLYKKLAQLQDHDKKSKTKNK